jgi:hypothetical protein
MKLHETVARVPARRKPGVLGGGLWHKRPLLDLERAPF